MKGFGKAVLGAMGLLVLGLVAMWLLTPSATDLLKRHFRLTDREAESEASIRAALLRKLPAGSSPEEIVRFLTDAGLGQEGRSRFAESANPKDPGYYCSIDYGGTFELVKEHYWIGLPIDEKRRLRDILVKRMLTGP